MLTCYLDSQDYSVLTDSRKLTPGIKQIRAKLINFASSREVQFVFSVASVSETVAISEETTKLAQGKVELLSELCGTNALISSDRLLKFELQSLYSRVDAPEHVFDPYGNWFPDIFEAEGEDNAASVISGDSNQDSNKFGLNRKERRANAKKARKNEKSHSESKERRNKIDSRIPAAAILEQCPMKPEYADVIARYCLKQATEQEFRKAFLSSIRDPKFMMQWFTNNYALSPHIAEIVRTPGRDLGEQLRHLVEVSVSRTELLLKAGGEVNPTSQRGIIFDHWSKMVDSHLVGIFNRAAKERNIQLGDIDAQLVAKYCPGVTTTIKSLFSSAWDNIGGGRKKPLENSQPVDALHAMYAPYVKVFRADRFMSPHIQAQVKHRGTIVVHTLEALVDVLNQEIQK